MKYGDVVRKPGQAVGVIQPAAVHALETLAVIDGFQTLKSEPQGDRLGGRFQVALHEILIVLVVFRRDQKV
jgi:hypothetical protein